MDRVPKERQWSVFDHESLEMMDLAYLTAATGHEFAILRGKHEDVLYYGTLVDCPFGDDDVLRIERML